MSDTWLKLSGQPRHHYKLQNNTKPSAVDCRCYDLRVSRALHQHQYECWFTFSSSSSFSSLTDSALIILINISLVWWWWCTFLLDEVEEFGWPYDIYLKIWNILCSRKIKIFWILNYFASAGDNNLYWVSMTYVLG